MTTALESTGRNVFKNWFEVGSTYLLDNNVSSCFV
jgi:hypothetical protein